MKAHTASLLNAIVLVAMSLWAYLGAGGASVTALIPAAFGLALLACYKGVRAENKVIAHVAVVLTVIVLIALVMPMRGAFGRGDALGALRVGLMMVTSAVAIGFFAKSFRDARRARG